MTVRAGILGQTKSFGTGATSIVLAMNHVLRRFLTAGLNKPEKNGAASGATLNKRKSFLSRARPRHQLNCPTDPRRSNFLSAPPL